MTAAAILEREHQTSVLAFQCPMCGGGVLEDNRRKVGWSFVTVLRCDERLCGFRYVARVDVIAALDPEDMSSPEESDRCGTNTGHMRHYRRGEAPCEACRIAHAQYVADWSRRARGQAS